MYHKMKAQFLRLPKQVCCGFFFLYFFCPFSSLERKKNSHFSLFLSLSPCFSWLKTKIQVRKMLFVVLRDKFGGDMAAAAAGRAVVAAREAPQETEAVATAAAAAAASLPAAPAAPRPPPLPPSLRAAAAAAFAASPSNPRPPRKRVMIAEPLEGEEEREEGGGGNGSSPSSPPLPPLKRQAPDDTAPFEPKREPAAGEVVFSANGSPLARFEDGGVLRTAAKGGMGLGTTRRAFANPVAMRDNNEATTFTILRPPGGGGGGGAGGLTRSGLAPGIEFALPSGKRVVVDVENSNFDDAGLTSKEAREVENYLQGLSRLANVALRSRKGRGGGGGSRR